MDIKVIVKIKHCDLYTLLTLSEECLKPDIYEKIIELVGTEGINDWHDDILILTQTECKALAKELENQWISKNNELANVTLNKIFNFAR